MYIYHRTVNGVSQGFPTCGTHTIPMTFQSKANNYFYGKLLSSSFVLQQQRKANNNKTYKLLK